VALLAIGVAGYSLRYVVLGEKAYVPELASSFGERPWAIGVHALFGPIALVGGLVQFLPAMRRPGRWQIHRAIGLCYVVSAVVLASAGLFMSQFSYGGMITHVGFALLAIGTLVTTLNGFRLIRSGRIVEHTQWMLRSYSLIFGAVTLRIWIPILMIATQGDFLTTYHAVAWISWVPNILFAEWIIRRGWKPSYQLGEASG
jgi:uncharacterized membrane protein